MLLTGQNRNVTDRAKKRQEFYSVKKIILFFKFQTAQHFQINKSSTSATLEVLHIRKEKVVSAFTKLNIFKNNIFKNFQLHANASELNGGETSTTHYRSKS